MKETYPKKPNEILVRITRRDIHHQPATGIAGQEEKSLAETLNKFLLRLGYASLQAPLIFVHLLTEGKVRVDFRAHIERLELVDPADKLTAPRPRLSLTTIWRN